MPSSDLLHFLGDWLYGIEQYRGLLGPSRLVWKQPEKRGGFTEKDRLSSSLRLQVRRIRDNSDEGLLREGLLSGDVLL